MRIGDTVTPRVNEKDYTLPSCGFTHVVGKEKEGHGGSGESTLRCSAIESGLYENNGALGFSNSRPKNFSEFAFIVEYISCTGFIRFLQCKI